MTAKAPASLHDLEAILDATAHERDLRTRLNALPPGELSQKFWDLGDAHARAKRRLFEVLYRALDDRERRR